MAKGELPGSMDLLLDTMCNTFGGVMFIAISMALTISLCQSNLDPAKHEAQAKEQLEQLRQENIQLQKKQQELDKSVEDLRKHKVETPDVSESLAEEVAQMEMQKKHRERQLRSMEQQLEQEHTATGKLQRENDRKSEKLAGEKRKHEQDIRNLNNRYANLQDENDKLRSELAQIPVKRLHFSRKRRTSSVPYIVIISNDRLYRLGYKSYESSREISVVREGNVLRLTPLHGISLNKVMSGNSADVLPGFNRKKHFVWIMVSPESFDSFVSFRRFMRKLNYEVHWYTTERMVLFLVQNAEYSSAN
ncbi:MAG: hypothetical protein IKC89_00575 [Lentisphaeria bacterium]|nr:hypothetical protein [Lentisphaeria bacterium]